MAKSQQKEKTGKEKFLEAFSGFLYKNKVAIISILSVVFTGLIILAVVLTIQQNKADKAASMAEDLTDHYTEWVETADEEDAEKEELKTLILGITDEITTTYPNTFAAQRALLIAGEMLYLDEAWEEAASYYAKLAQSYPESYLAPVALASASAMYENAGLTEDALKSAETLISEYGGTSVEAPHAFFTVGRLREQKGDIPGALEIYRELTGKFPQSSWTKAAQDRIIVLEPEEQ